MIYKVTTTQYFQEDPVKIGNFHAKSRDLWNDYVWRNRSYLTTSMDNHPSNDSARQWASGNSGDFYDTINDYYGSDIAQRWRSIFNDQQADMIQFLEYIKKPPTNFNINTDVFVQDLFTKLKNGMSELFDLMATINPGTWNQLNLKNQLLDLIETWFSQINMRLIKNWNDDLSALDREFDVAREIAHLFATGVIQQHADKFAVAT